MTRDEIIRMAREACGEDQDPFVSGWVTMDHNEFARFASLVAATEREACAKLCDEMEANTALSDLEKYRTRFISDAIRARGQA
jgi:hypothetical protein